MNKYFSKEDIQIANRNMKRYSTLVIIREIQIKIAMVCHLTPVRIAILKRTQITNVGDNVEKGEPSYTVGGNVN